MFLDNVVLAGVLTVGLMFVFMIWFGIIAYRRIHQDKE